MDYRNNILSMDKNTVLYGHAMKNNTMFGNLKNYFKQGYVDKHPILYLDTLYEGYEQERSAIQMDVDLSPEDKILTLSTCKDAVMSDDYRIVMQGKLVKRGG